MAPNFPLRRARSRWSRWTYPVRSRSDVCAANGRGGERRRGGSPPGQPLLRRVLPPFPPRWVVVPSGAVPPASDTPRARGHSGAGRRESGGAAALLTRQNRWSLVISRGPFACTAAAARAEPIPPRPAPRRAPGEAFAEKKTEFRQTENRADRFWVTSPGGRETGAGAGEPSGAVLPRGRDQVSRSTQPIHESIDRALRSARRRELLVSRLFQTSKIPDGQPPSGGGQPGATRVQARRLEVDHAVPALPEP